MAGKMYFEELISEEEIKVIIEKTIKSKDFELLKFSIRAASEHPMGFLGIHGKILVRIKARPGEEEEFNYFVKAIPSQVPEHMDYALRTRAFYKEIELYKTLFVDLKNAYSSKGRKWCPEYYYSRGEEIFVTEDLSASGYYMLPERLLLDEDHIKAALKAMAAMHAACFIFEENLPNNIYTEKAEIGEIYKHLVFETEASDEEGHPGNTYYEAGIRSQLKIIDILPGLSTKERENIKIKLPNVLREMFQLVKPSKKYKNIFVHGDLWANNLLFRTESNGEVSALLIDFQLARYAPPAHDVMLFFHLVQTKEFREKSLESLLNFYYNRLSEELADNGLSAEKILPKEVFIESCEVYDDLGLLSSVLYFQLILMPSEISAKFLSSTELFNKTMLEDRSELIVECFRKDELFRTRMTNAMSELISKHIR